MRKSKEEGVPQMRKKTRKESIHSLAFSFLLPVTVLLFALCLSAEAQQPTKIARVGYLNPGDPVSRTYRTEAFRQGLKELGYIEGKISSSNIGSQRLSQIGYPSWRASLSL